MDLGFTVMGAAVSSNAAYGIKSLRKRKMYMKEVGVKWKHDVGWSAIEARKSWEAETLEKWDLRGQYSVDLTFFWNDKRKRDAHNLEKLTFDAMQRVLYNDDSQIIEHHVRRGNGEPRVEIKVRKTNVELH